jgi:hypothetical protein
MTTARENTMKNLSMKPMLVALALAGCTGLDISNEPPTAVAKVIVGGMEYPSGTEIPYNGAPTDLTLDGLASTDEDGDVVAWEWYRTDVAATDRFGAFMLPMPVPRYLKTDYPAAFAGDPGSGPTRSVALPEGTYQFSLWVTDDDKALSEPATVTFEVKTPSIYMPDPACMMTYENPNVPTCEECLCSPNSTGGCLEQFQACANNADPGFNEACLAVVNCAVEKSCSGAACYVAEGCMAEIDAASAFAGETVATCASGDPATNPCSASSRLGACTAGTPEMPGACRASCSAM